MVRRPTEHGGRRFQGIVRRGSTDSVRDRRTMTLPAAPASSPAEALLVAAA